MPSFRRSSQGTTGWLLWIGDRPKDCYGLFRQRYAVRPAPLHPFSRNFPNTGVQVKLAPVGKPDFTRPRRREYQKFKGQGGRSKGISESDFVEGPCNVGVR